MTEERARAKIAAVALCFWGLALMGQAPGLASPAAGKTADAEVASFFAGLRAVQNGYVLSTSARELSRGLAEIGPAAVPALIRALEDDSEGGRAARARQEIAALALGRIGTGEAVETLLRSSADPSVLARALALAHANLATRATARDCVLRGLADTRVGVRLLAASAAGLSRDSAFVQPLLALTTGPDLSMVAKACSALGAIGDPAAAEQFSRIARDPQTYNPTQRRAALAALAQIGHPAVVPLSLEALHWAEPEIRVAALEALEKVSDASVVEEVLPLLKSPNKDVVAATCHVLGTFGDGRAVPGLLAVLEGAADAASRFHATEALVSIGDPRALPALVERLRSAGESLDDLMGLAGYIARFGEAGAEELAPLLDSEGEDLRIAAASGLCAQGDPRGFLPLTMADRPDGAAAEIQSIRLGRYIMQNPDGVAALLAPQGAPAHVRRRIAAIMATVSYFGMHSTVPGVVKVALKRAACVDPEPEVRQAALAALQELGRPHGY